MASVTIGIPVYNEEANIGCLLKDILLQMEDGFVLDKIIVSSDASTDKTVEISKSISDPRIEVIDNPDRIGKFRGNNQISSLADSDVLILFDGDIRILDPLFIKKLIQPILDNRAELTSPLIRNIKPTKFYDKLLDVSLKFKQSVTEEYRSGNTIYSCYGVARAFSKKLYKQMVFPNITPEDAYSYLFSVSSKMRFQTVKTTEAYFRLPNNYQDHRKQSVRFYDTRPALYKFFGEELVTKEFYIPSQLWTMAGLNYLLKYPFKMLLYVGLIGLNKLQSVVFPKKESGLWEIATSSKKLRIKR